MSISGSSVVAGSHVLDHWDSPLPPETLNVVPSKPGHMKVPFLRGPTSAEWLRRMCDTKSSVACRVGLALLTQSGIQNSKTVRFGSRVRKVFDISRPNAKRGLDSLIEAGLIEIVEQNPGSLPVVRIIAGGGIGK